MKENNTNFSSSRLCSELTIFSNFSCLHVQIYTPVLVLVYPWLDFF